jgi:hypothetical protein
MTKPLRAPYKVGRLDSLAAVRSELGRLYRYAWGRKMDINEATRFAYILKELRCAIEAEVTERLEKQLMTTRNGSSPGSWPTTRPGMAINRSLINRIEKVIEVAEAVLGRADQPLILRPIVLDGDDEGEVKARALAAHLVEHPEDSGRPVEWEIFRIAFVSPAPEPPRDSEAHYIVADGR